MLLRQKIRPSCFEERKVMAKDKPNNEWNFDQEGEMTVHQQITDAYQSGVVDMLDQHAKRSKTEDEESLQ
jgi:type IV secretory pathway VirD2 relaxase